MAPRTPHIESGPTERRIKEVTSLKRKKRRDELGCFIVEGVRNVESALQAGAPFVDLFVTADVASDERLQHALRGTGVSRQVVSDRIMAKMSDTSSPSGALAVVRLPEPTVKCISCMKKVLVLDGVQDPGNVGTLIRTAAWFGIDAVVSGPGTADFFAPKTVRSAMGGLWDVVLEQVDYLEGFIASNVRFGVDVRVADLDGESIQIWKPASNSMIVIGSEAHGVSEGVRTAASGSVTIPGHPKRVAVESLNAAVAGSILMSHWN